MNRLGLCLSLTLVVACSDDGLTPAQEQGSGLSNGNTSSDGNDASEGTGDPAPGTTSGMENDTEGPGSTSGSPPSDTTSTSGDDGDSGSTTGEGSSDDGGTTTGEGSSSTGQGSSDGGMMDDCPDIAGTTLIGGPADLYGYCWYLSAPMDTCDSACAELPGGANLALMAESSYPDSCGSPSPGDVSTWFFDNGNPGGWTSPGGSTSGHTLGYGYSMVGSFYGKCSTGPVQVGTYPGEMVGGGLEAERQLVCACAVGTP